MTFEVENHHEYLHRKREEINERIDRCKKIVNDEHRKDRGFKQSVVIPAERRALQKINEGSYGFCDECGTQINTKRLERIPGAIRCVSCQTFADTK